MRRLCRPRVLLPTLCRGGKGGEQAEENRLAREKDDRAVLAFPDHWKEPDVRGALYAMHGWVCAYCQRELTGSDRGDVEHFRPKQIEGGHQIYWWLAYTFDNYLLSCRRCNSAYKGDCFPLAPGALRTTYATQASLEAELRLLADPAADPVEQWMRVTWLDENDDAAKIRIVGTLDPGTAGRVRSGETIDFFGLNRDPPLEYERKLRLSEAENHYRKYQRGVDPDYNREELQRMASRFRPFGIAVRNLVEDLEPSLLPEEVDELEWLLDEIGERLEVALLQLALEGGEVPYAERIEEELFFALATLWLAPPAGDEGRAVVEAWLTETGLGDPVRARMAQLRVPPP